MLKRLLLGLIMMVLSHGAWATLSFLDFFEEHPTPMWMLAVESGDILRANPAARAFYGYEDFGALNIRDINMLTPAQIEEEIRLAGASGRDHLFMRHRLADGSVKVMGIYTQRLTYQGQEVLLSSLYDTSEFESNAERHYIARVEEQVDLQTAQLIEAREHRMWLAWGAALAQAVAIGILLVVLLRLRNAQRENRRLIGELSFRNQELERLSHAMAHHFQEPSRRLVSFAQQLERKLGDSDDDSSRMAVGFIGSQATRLSSLVADVQRYLSLDSMAIREQNVSPQAVLEEVYLQTPELAEARRANALTLPSSLPEVHFDSKRLALIFRLLLHNAWQYRSSERPLRIHVSARQVGARVSLAVEDNGVGIEPEYRAQVLEMFSRLKPNSEQYPGTGMGLALVVKALRCVEGKVRIELGPQGGTRVEFDLPAAR